MSRSATPNNTHQLPSKSAWARGPRATTTPSRLQSPATPTPVSVTNPPNFHATHSRRSSALGQGVSIKVNIPRSAVKQGSAVTFGSIDDASAPVPSSPASVPATKPADGVKSFGSVAVQNDVSDAAVPCRPPHHSSAPSTLCHPAAASTSATSPVPKFDKKSIAKLFSGPSTQTVPSPATWSGYYYHPQFIPGVPPDPPSVAPPPSTPSTANRPTSLVANASAFIPGKKITIKNPSGQEVDLDALKRLPPPTVPIVPAGLPSPASVKKKKKKRLVLLESQKQKERRLAEGKAREGETEEKDRTNESFTNASEDPARRQIEEQELRKAEERKSKEEAERTEKERNEAEERAEQERLHKLREEKEAKDAGTLADATSDAKPDPFPEDGEIEDEADKVRRANTAEETSPNETASVPLPVPTSALATARPIEDLNRISYPEGIKNPKAELNVNAQKGRFRYDRDFLLQFMNICKERPDNLPLLDMIGKRPGPRNLQTATTGGSAPALSSALRTARDIEDINRISYPEGIENPKVQLDVNTQVGKVRARTASVVPIGPLPSGSSPFTPKPSRGPGASRPANFLGVGTGESETPDNSRRQNDDSFLQHGKYFFKDGNVTFLVDGFLYCVHRYLFSHGSVYFSTRFAQLGVRDHEALSTVVPLGDVEREDFEAFLSVLYPDFAEHNLSYEQWRSVLCLSTRWGFASRRKLALESIKPPTPYDRLLLARQYAVDHWVSPALIALCERTAPLSLDEARRMNIEDLVLIATMREEIFRFGVSAAEIPRRIEAMQAEALVRVAGDDVPLASSKSKATEQGPGSMANAIVDSDLEQFHGTKTIVTEPFKGKTPLSGWNLAGATTKSQIENIEQSDGEQYWQSTKVTPNDEWDALPFKMGEVKMQEDEEQRYQTTTAGSNDEWDKLPFKRKRGVRRKQMNVQHWQTAKGVPNDE